MKHVSISQKNIEKDDNRRDGYNHIQSFSQIQTSPSLKSLTQNTLPTTPSNHQHLKSVKNSKANNRSHQVRLSLSNNNGEIQFFTPREVNAVQNKLASPNSHRQYVAKFFQSPSEQVKQQTQQQQSEISLNDEHLEIKEMAGGAGNIQRATQHFLSIKQGNHIPLKQLNAISNSMSQRQGFTEQSELQNSHYFSTNNTFFKGLTLNQRNNQSSMNDGSLLKQKSRHYNDRILTDQSDFLSKPIQQLSNIKKVQSPASIMFDDRREDGSIEKSVVPKIITEQIKSPGYTHGVLSRYNSGRISKDLSSKNTGFRISSERATTEESQYHPTGTDRLHTDEGFNNFSIIGNIQQSPMLKRKSIEKNILLGQPQQKNSSPTNKKANVSQFNEINLFERKKSTQDKFKSSRNNSITLNTSQNSFKQPPALNHFMSTPIQANNSKFKTGKSLNIYNPQNVISNNYVNSRNDSPAEPKKSNSPNKSGINGSLINKTQFSPPHNNGNMNTTTVSLTKQMCLAATDFQYQKQLREQERQQKKIRFGSEMFSNFQIEIDRIRKAFANKQDIEPILNHYKQNYEICFKTIVIAQKCLVFKKSRAPLEALLRSHSKQIEQYKQHPNLQLFILLQIAKIFIDISSPLIAIPILKVVKRQSFLNMQNGYLMKAYRSLAQCYCTIQKFDVNQLLIRQMFIYQGPNILRPVQKKFEMWPVSEVSKLKSSRPQYMNIYRIFQILIFIAFGYAAKYLHLSWTCDSTNNELNAYEMLGKIYFYLGDAKKSAYYHNRMAMNIREGEESSLRKMQTENLKTIYKRRYEIQAAREMKKSRKKLDEKNDGSLYMVSSDEENDLNQLIPEENKDLQEENKPTINKSQIKNQQLQQSQIKSMSKTAVPLRKMPKFDIKSDKGCLLDTQVKANQDIRIEAKKKENFVQFLKKPYEQFIQYKSMKGIGPMRDKLLISHKSHNKNLSNFLFSQINKKLKASNIFFTQLEQNDKDKLRGDQDDDTNKIYNHNQDDEINQDIQHNMEQSEYWKETIVKNVEKSLRKLILNIQYLNILRDELKLVHEEKIQNKSFFDLEEDTLQSEQEKLMKKILDSKTEKQEQYWSHLV